jgi:predicted phosphodiesterase
MKTYIFTAALLLLISCGIGIDYNPYVENGRYDNLTKANLQRIEESNGHSFFPFTIIVTADLHAYYTDTKNAIPHMNNVDSAAFTLIAGDITDLGLVLEYERNHDILKNLSTPYLSVIGNHDALSNGKDVYKKMYGDFSFSFTYNNVKFILFNTNKEEFNGREPDLAWLEEQLSDADSFHHTVIMSHQPFDDPVFSQQTRDSLFDLVREYNVSLLINGHDHNFVEFTLPTANGGHSTHLTVGSTIKRYFHTISFSSDSLTREIVYF